MARQAFHAVVVVVVVAFVSAYCINAELFNFNC